MGANQSVSQGRRKSKRRKCCRHKSKESVWKFQTLTLCWFLFPLLLLHLPGAVSLPLEGQKGNNITFPCDRTAENASIRLTRGSIKAYASQVHSQYKDRVRRTGHCGLVLGGLKTTDAGRYTLKIHVNGHSFHELFNVSVSVNLTGHEGEELVFDDLPSGAQRVVYSSGSQMGARTGDVQGKEMWVRGKGVLDNKLIYSDGRLSIRNFSASDAGAYRVLDEAGGILNTILIEGSCTESHVKRRNDTEQHSTGGAAVYWPLCVVLVVMAVGFGVFWRLRRFEDQVSEWSLLAWWRVRLESVGEPQCRVIF